MTVRVAVALLAAVTLLRLVVAGLTPLAPDEAYYWVWSHALAAGYLDHPPMVALWIRAGTAIAGTTPLGVRLLGPLSAGLGSILLWQAARDLLADRAAATRAAVLLNATLLFGAGSVTMTPDTPLLFFWTLGLWAMARLIATGRSGWWYAAGAAAGLALCSKYTAVLLPFGIAVWLTAARREWRWLRHPAPWLAGLFAAGLFAPTLAWNARHGWVSFAKQGGRNLVFAPAQWGGHVAELIGGQIGLATPVLWVLCVAGVIAVVRLGWQGRAPAPVLLAALSVPGLALFAEHALGDRVQANWPAIIYPAAAVAAGQLAGGWRRWVWPGAALGAGLTLIVYVQGVAAPLPLPPRLDPTARLAGYAALAAGVQAEADRRGAGFVAVDDYGTAAELALLEPRCGRIIGWEQRWSWFDLPPGAAWTSGRTGLLMRPARRLQAPSMDGWASLTHIGQIARARGGAAIEAFDLYAVVGRGGGAGAALLPCRSAAAGLPPVPPD